MARKIPKAHSTHVVKEAAEPQDNELEVLNSERDLMLGGKTYTVREYGHVEWFRLLAHAEPLVAEVAEQIKGDQIGTLSFEDVLMVFSKNMDTMTPIILLAAGMTADEFHVLELAEIEALLMVWWGVNYRFFLQRGESRVLMQIKEESSRARVLALDKSTPHSLHMAMPSETSSTTPTAS